MSINQYYFKTEFGAKAAFFLESTKQLLELEVRSKQLLEKDNKKLQAEIEKLRSEFEKMQNGGEKEPANNGTQNR